MFALYHELLDATARHLRDLKGEGARFVSVPRETWSSLISRPVLKAKPAPKFLPDPVPAPSPESNPVLEIAPIQTISAGAAPESNAASMEELRQRALVCQKCQHLVRSRTQVVFGVGDLGSPLMFVGEAPGAEEDEQGEPFVGKAGQLLTRMIQAMGFTRETVYIANVLKCRPDTPGQTSGNRKPTAEEMKTCLPYLLAQIDLIRPKVVVALGATAMEGLFGKAVSITKARGNFQELRGIPVMPTFHPAYLLRNQSMAVKRQVWEDMLQVMEKLELLITEKQRNYFLKKE
jgi:uracil-DNA glycosylase